MLKFKASRATIPAQDIKRARQFYEQRLGLKPVEEQSDGAVFYQAGETRFLVFPSRGKASGDHTQMGLEVEDITSAVKELQNEGVTFEEYDYPDFKTVGGIVDDGSGKAAWFRDTEGNLIGLRQLVPVGAKP